MNNFYKLLAVPFIVALGSGITSCAPKGSADSLTLRVLNSEDYIYIQETEEDMPDMVDQFIDWVTTTDDERCTEFHGKNVKVIYDCSDTNETIYSELMTGKSNYDLINCSDYMAQKIVSGGYAVPILNNENDDKPWEEIPNYESYASKRLKGTLDAIEAVQKKLNPDTGKYEDVKVPLEKYAVGYMWGTLGILFNPYFNTGIAPDSLLDQYYAEDEDAEKLQSVINDMQTFDAMWNTKYKGTISIKNSMRDTYAMGLFHAYDNEFSEIREEYLTETITLEQYQAEFASIFNRCDEKNVNDVENALNALKSNIFGLEVDSGKQDIVTQKIGVNLAWSGDAVYSMDQAQDGLQVGDHQVELCYAVPENGTNLWFDVWIMPNCARSQEQSKLAKLFLDFLCDPANASQNMDYTGYTSFIGGDDIIELVRDWYDVRTYEIYQEVETKYVYEYYTVYRTDGVEEFEALDYPDCMSTDHDDSVDEQKLYYFVPYVKDGELIEEPEDVAALTDGIHGFPVYLLDDDEETIDIKTYADLLIADIECEDPESGIEAVDLRYFFEGTLCDDTEYTEEDMIFYSDCYLPFLNEEGEQNISVGRQFFCQYPNEDVINRSAVMRDFGANNTYVMKMWERFKSNPLPTGSIIVFVVIIASLLALLAVVIIGRILKSNLRKKRKAQK